MRTRHDRLVGHLRAVAESSGHDPARLRVVAVTKTHPVDVVREAMDAGLTRFGESRVQEAEPKMAALPAADWHFVGRLQSNKARRVVRAFSTVHSVGTPALLRRIDELAAEEERASAVLLQVNVTGEVTKAGLAPDELAAVALPEHVQLVGLMTIAPMGVSRDEARTAFARLRRLRDELEQRLGIGLPELSMGMSADAEAAAAEGATLVRIGTALFGPRAETLVSSDP